MSEFGKYLIVAFATLWGVSIGHCQTQQYPSRAVSFVVGFPPGGGADTLGRVAAQHLGLGLGQQVVVQNEPGAGGVVATNMVARSAADGYTLLFTSIPHVINPHLYSGAKYDPIRDFISVVQFASVPLMLATTAGLQVKSARQLIGYAKSNPGKLNYGTAGSGTSSHLAMELFKSMTGTDIVHVPYKGAGPLTTALISSEVQVVILNAVVLAPHVSSGKLRGLAITSPVRSAAFPQLPPMSDEIPGYEVVNWFGIFAPAGTAQIIVNRINAVINSALQSQSLVKDLNSRGADVAGESAAEFSAIVKSDFVKWGKVVKDVGARID